MMNYFRSRAWVWGVITVLGLGVASLPAQAETRFAVGDAVNFSVDTTDGRTITSTQMKDFLIVVHFWAAISEPSVQNLPDIQRLHETYGPQGVGIISVSVDPDPAAAKQMIESQQLETLAVINAEQPRPVNAQFFTQRYGVPHTFLIAPDGTLIWDGHPFLLEEQIKEALVIYPPPTQSFLGQDSTLDMEDPFALPAVDGEAIARLASQAIFSQPPDFHILFMQIKDLPPEAFDQAKVKSFGRSVGRSLERLDAEQQENYDLYRTTYPETAELLDQWIAASARSISGSGGAAVNPELVASKLQQAEDAEADGDDLAAYELYRWIVDRAPNSDEAMLAQDIVLILEDDEAFMAQVEAEKLESQAGNLMAMARNFAAAGLEDKAEETYQQVIADFPTTDAAKKAAEALDK